MLMQMWIQYVTVEIFRIETWVAKIWRLDWDNNSCCISDLCIAIIVLFLMDKHISSNYVRRVILRLCPISGMFDDLID